jgi:hypothetical protein
MNKSGYQPMPVLLRAEPGEGRPTSDSAKILRVVATVGGVFALCGAVAICLVGFNALPSKSGESKVPVSLPIHPETKALAATESTQDDGAALQPTAAAQVQRATPAEDHSVNEPVPTPALNPSSPPAPMVNPETAMSDKELLQGGRPEAQQIEQGRHLSEVARRKLERKRRATEERRAALEDDFQNHAISSATYRKGVTKYQAEIAKYRKEMNAGTAVQD